MLDFGEARVQAVLATNPFVYWRQAEGSGLLIRDSAPGGLYPGTYTGITWDAPPTTSPYGKPTPFFDGANDYGNVYSAAFASAFNFDEGCILLFLKVANAGVWTDATFRRALRFQRDASQEFSIHKTTTANQVVYRRQAGGVNKQVIVSTFTEMTWLGMMLSYTVAGDALKAYKNGVQQGATQTGNVAATGSGLSSAATLIGAEATTPTAVFHGYLAEVIVWTKPADAAMIALGVPPA